MNKATFLIVETNIFTSNYSPCRYESLEVDLNFRNYEDVKESRPPHVVSLAPWQEEQRPCAHSSSPSITRPTTLRRKLTTDDYAQCENPDRLKFCWENTARNERPSFPTGSVITTPHQATDVHNTVHWSLQTDNVPLNEWQRTTKETQTSGYTHAARTAFAILLQREHNNTFFTEMELKVKGDVYKAAEKRWIEEQSGETLPGNIIIVFQPDSPPVQDTYYRERKAGKVDREELGYWTEAKRGQLEGLKACPVFRPLRIPGQE